MKKSEREIVARAMDILQGMGSLHPFNPCDIAKLSIASRASSGISSHLYRALSSLGFGDLEDALGHLGEAEAALDEARAAREEADRKFYR